MRRTFRASTWRAVHGRIFAQSPTHLIQGQNPGNITAPHTFWKGFSNTIQPDRHHYTCGRWLRDDAARRQARYVDFDFQLLCDRVVRLSPGATAVRSWQKKEGGFNRIFIMDLDSGSKLVAKIPYPGVDLPQRLATASEVATIAYLQQHTNVPIPRVIEWNSDPQNPVGCEYIIMTEARGVMLSEKWPQMTGSQRVSCIDSIFQHMKQLQNLEFSGYGSLIFHEEISLGSTEKFDLDPGFCLSQHCGIRYWDSDSTSRTPIHRGPWRDLQEFADSLVDVGIARVPAKPTIAPGPLYQGSPQEHCDILSTGRSVLRAISASPSVQNASKPLLYHPDLHARNIFVSEHNPTVVTDIIDWQGTSVEPAFWYADETPDFANPNDELCGQIFAVCSAFLIPKLAAAQRMDENIFRPYRYCYRTWKDGIAAYRHELAETLEGWSGLGLRVDRPEIDVDFIREDQKSYDLFVTAQTLKKDLAGLLECQTDGWVRVEAYEATKKYHDELFHGMLQAVLEDDDPDPAETVNDEETLRAIWPFDLDV